MHCTGRCNHYFLDLENMDYLEVVLNKDYSLDLMELSKDYSQDLRGRNKDYSQVLMEQNKDYSQDWRELRRDYSQVLRELSKDCLQGWAEVNKDCYKDFLEHTVTWKEKRVCSGNCSTVAEYSGTSLESFLLKENTAWVWQVLSTDWRW